jgi:anti-sigma regulatory factor (Ser/Thr protein kinase)
MAGSPPKRWQRTYQGRLDQVAVARGFAASLLAGTGRADDVAIIVSELASNALLHTRSGRPRGWFGLEVCETELVHVGVTDLGGGGRPTVYLEQAAGELLERGRGLLEVSRLAVAIGIHGSPETGHTVWADLAPHRGEASEGAQAELLVP